MLSGTKYDYRRALLALAWLLLWGVPWGCGEAEERIDPRLPSLDADLTEGSFGRISLRASHHWTPGQDEPENRMELSAVFVQHLGVAANDAWAQAGLADVEPPLEPGTCSPIEPPPLPPARALTGDDALVDLLDAGVIYVVIPAHSTLVRPSLYPDVLPHVSGVHYRSTFEGREEGFSLRSVRLHGFGGRDVGSFELIQRSGPEEVRIIQVAQGAPWEAPFAVRVNAPMTVQWAPADPEAEVLVTLRWRAGAGHAEAGLRCRSAYPGEHIFSPAVLARVGVGPAGQEVTLGVSTVQRESMPLPDGFSVWLHLSQSDEVTLVLTP